MGSPPDMLSELTIFLLKLVLTAAVGLASLGVIARAFRAGSLSPLRVQRLDRRWQAEGMMLARTAPRKGEMRRLMVDARRLGRQKAGRPRVFVLRFDGGIEARGTRELAAEINALLQVGTEGDEVVLRLRSGGGLVTAYGHAASQLARVREAGLRLTVAIDEVAASGGYLMAAMADRILAAPFALVGSIGVVAQIPNVHRLLKRHDVDVELHTAGRWKRTLTVLGENTDEGRARFRADLERTFARFKEALARHRPRLDLEAVATGETWYGSEAVALGLVDEVITSDAYLLARARDAEVLALSAASPRAPLGRLGGLMGFVGRRFGAALGRTIGERFSPRRLVAESQDSAEPWRL